MKSAQSFRTITLSMSFPFGKTHHCPVVLHHGSVFHPRNLPQEFIDDVLFSQQFHSGIFMSSRMNETSIYMSPYTFENFSQSS